MKNLLTKLDIPSADLYNARRGKLLNILLMGVSLAALITLLFAFYLDLTDVDELENIQSLYLLTSSILLGSMLLLFVVNRYGMVWLASSLFLMLLTFAVIIVERPQDLLGRSIFFLSLPVLIASLLIRPWASFGMAGIISVIIIFTSLQVQEVVHIPAVLGFFFLAIVSWLSSRSLESALRDLRKVNAELEQRVEERTRKLAEANRELSTMNQRLSIYAQELETSNAELDAFARTVAHELKGPISIIGGFSALLIERMPSWHQEKVIDTVHRIQRNSNRMTNIIDELLLLASVRKQKDIEIGPLSMDRIMAEVRDRLDEMIAESQAEIIEPEAWPVAVGYGPWIEEVWANYLSNALKYGGEPPRVELGATEISGNGKPPMVRFWIRDNGSGLTEEEQAQLFTQFTRLHLNQARGHGLGLSIVQRIVEKLDGDVGVESEPGKGSTFYFTLPLRENRRTSTAARKTADS